MYNQPSEDKKLRAYADNLHLQYVYRKHIVPGMSWKQFCEEPYEVYLANLMFYTIKRQRKEAEYKKLERKNKTNG